VAENVYATSILEDGHILVETTAIEEDTTFGKIVEMVIEAQDKKSRAWRFMDRFSTYYTPAVLLFGILMGLIFWDLALGVTILVLGCPGALVIGIPVSNVAGIGFAAKQGILFKGSETIGDLAKSHVFIFDKTGTLTKGTPEVVEIIDYVEHPHIQSYYRSLEQSQTHPLAKAIVQYVANAPLMELSNLEVYKGKGLGASINGNRVLLGNIASMNDNNIDILPVKEAIKRFEEKGLSYVILAENRTILSIVSIGDQLRDHVEEDIKRLQKLGVKETYILSGDNQAAVDRLVGQLGMTKGYGNMLPEDKKAFVDNLIKKGKKVTFIGDGINDAPSLASATIGIAMKGGTDVAVETSDVVLMHNDFNSLVNAKKLAQKIQRNIWENLAIAIAVVLTLLYLVIFEEGMTMSIGMLVHELSILIVILNGMRLLKTKIKENEYEKTNFRT
jgi:Cd2+/Zn2+-exporting ATPase